MDLNLDKHEPRQNKNYLQLDHLKPSKNLNELDIKINRILNHKD